MDKNQNSAFSNEDDKSDSGNRSGNDKLIEFPTSGNSAQFKIDGGFVNTLIPNRNSHYKNVFNNSEDRGTIKVQIFLNIEFDFDGKIEMLKINDELPPSHMTIESIITMAITEFNDILEKRDSKHRINPNDSIWNLYMSKKNGKPKQDLPALDRDNLLSDTQEDMFTLDTKNPDKLWDADEDKWIDYKLKQEDDDNNEEYVADNNSKKNKLIESKQTMNENKQTQVNQEIPNTKPQLISKIPKQKKNSKDVSSSCYGLCSFSKKA